MTALLECNNITKKYATKTAINNINLTLEEGKIIGLIGVNGSGKTSLIKMLAGFTAPTSGEITVYNAKSSDKIKSIVSYLPDKLYLDERLTIDEIISLFANFFSDFDKDYAYNLLNNLHINAEDKFKNLSHGIKCKVQLVMTMSRNAKLYVLDEPFNGSDVISREQIISTILSGYNPNTSVIISAHNISEIEKIIDDFILMKDGDIVKYGNVDELREIEGKSLEDLFKEVYQCC